jgi:hypothetical protein
MVGSGDLGISLLRMFASPTPNTSVSRQYDVGMPSVRLDFKDFGRGRKREDRGISNTFWKDFESANDLSSRLEMLDKMSVEVFCSSVEVILSESNLEYQGWNVVVDALVSE